MASLYVMVLGDVSFDQFNAVVLSSFSDDDKQGSTSNTFNQIAFAKDINRIK